MGISVGGSNNLFDPRKYKENPFKTESGQSVVSPSDTFWSRIAKNGRSLNLVAYGSTTVNANFQVYGSTSLYSGVLYYPKQAILTTDTPCELRLDVMTKYTAGNIIPPQNDVTAYQRLLESYVAYVSAGIPFVIDFDGEIFIDADLGATIQLKYRTATAGKVWGTVIGWEVSKNYA